jgi:hypothetical protein
MSTTRLGSADRPGRSLGGGTVAHPRGADENTPAQTCAEYPFRRSIAFQTAPLVKFNIRFRPRDR